MCISAAVQTHTSPANMELCLLGRAVLRALPSFTHHLGTQLSADYMLILYADTLLKIYKINEMEILFPQGHDAPFPVERNWILQLWRVRRTVVFVTGSKILRVEKVTPVYHILFSELQHGSCLKTLVFLLLSRFICTGLLKRLIQISVASLPSSCPATTASPLSWKSFASFSGQF